MTAEELLTDFRRMEAEHWAYSPGAAEKGCVDCSGAFVWAFRQHGKSIAHGSNTIARQAIRGELLPISQIRAGMAVFKVRDWTAAEQGNRWYGTLPGDLYHIGLADGEGGVLNARSGKDGFVRSPLQDGWSLCAPLKQVAYPQDTAPAIHEKEGSVTAIVKGGTLNLRAAPRRSAERLARLPQGTVLEVLETSGSWSRVACQGQTGWVMSAYLTEELTLTLEKDAAEALLKALQSALSSFKGVS